MTGDFDVGGDVIVNRGLISGDVTYGLSTYFEAKPNLFDNRGGVVDGTVNMGAASDIFDNRGGSIVGQVNLGDGDDKFIIGSGPQNVDGGEGFDTLDFTRAGAITFALATSEGQIGLPLDSKFSNFEQVLGSLSGVNVIDGDDNGNFIYGGRAGDKLSGAAGIDRLEGEGGNDILLGGAGHDTLEGGAGNDILTGGADADDLEGGAGADTFVFLDTATTGDVIYDFSRAQKDKIDLSAIDANPIPAGNQAFTYIGSGAFTNHAGELHIRTAPGPLGGNATYVEGDTNGNGVADFSFVVIGVIPLVAADFVL